MAVEIGVRIAKDMPDAASYIPADERLPTPKLVGRVKHRNMGERNCLPRVWYDWGNSVHNWKNFSVGPVSLNPQFPAQR